LSEISNINIEHYYNETVSPNKRQRVEDKYCVCRQPWDNKGLMIGCDGCDEWYHPVCIDLIGAELAKAQKSDKWFCVRCKT